MKESVRQAVRAVLVDSEDRVLLVKYADYEKLHLEDQRPREYWVPPGGAVEGDETDLEALQRELLEETGLSTDAGPQLWERRLTMRFQGKLVDQFERYYLSRIESASPFVRNRSKEPIIEHRWWRLEDIQSSTEQFFPEALGDLLIPILRGEIPPAPLNII